MRLFTPSPRATNWLLATGFLSLGYAFYLRYLVIEQSAVGLACDAGLDTWLCSSRLVATRLFNHQVFGWAAVGAAALSFVRPSVPLFAIAIVATGFGLVLYNTGLAGFAAAILIVSFARPAPEQE
jgi:hypothetical protein